MRYGFHDILVLPQDLQDFAWSAPMRDLAKKVGLSDVGLKKLLKAQGVSTPPQGYWNRVHAGKPVPRRPEMPERGPGERGRLCVDARFADVIPAAEPLSSSGPFVSARVPEDLEELYRRELRAIGRVAVPRKLGGVHPGLAPILRKEQQRREKADESRWHWDEPKFDSVVDQRRLRLFNALFMALGRRGHHASACDRDGRIDATAVIGDTRVDINIMIAGTDRTVRMYCRDLPAKDLLASTPLALVIGGDRDRAGENRWRDDAAGKLEAKLAEITARLVVAGEAAFRRGLREAEEREEQYRRWEEQRRREQIEARNRERLKQLRESGELLRQAQDLRALIAGVGDAVIAGSVELSQERLGEWEQWAAAEADRLDPILSGQIMTHLAPLRGDGG